MIAVLITVHNRKESTLRCLKDLETASKQISSGLDVYLVDDNSSDGTSSAVRELFPDTRIIEGNGNLYWNRGMHLAWKTAVSSKAYDHFLWLNNDTYLFPDALSRLIEFSEMKNHESIIVGQVESDTPGEPSYGAKLKSGKPVQYKNGLARCDLINGNCVLVPSFVFQSVGCLDYYFTHALGDHDYSLRAEKKGIKSFLTEDFLGYCKKNDRPPVWCRPECKLIDRIKNLYSPLAYSHPRIYFTYVRRHFGLAQAVYCMLTNHLRLIFPKLWKS